MSKKQSGNVAAFIILGIVAVLVGVVIVWRYNEANSALDQADQAATNQSSNTSASTEATIGYEGRRISSNRGAFSIVAPNGWTGMIQKDDDFIKFADVNYDKTKAPSIKTGQFGGDGFRTGVTVYAGSASTYIDNDTQTDDTSFQLNSEITGTKRYKQYKEGEALGISNAQGNEISYSYLFKKNDKVYVVTYNRYSSEEDHSEFVEKVVRTLRIN